MSAFFDEIKFATNKPFDTIEITEMVKKSVKSSGVSNGIVVLFTQHTTGALRISEYEKSLQEDYRWFFDQLVPKAHEYGHNKTNVDERPNAHSHLQSMTLNSSETIPLKDGKLTLGKWQSIFFIELDGPRSERRVTVEVIG